MRVLTICGSRGCQPELSHIGRWPRRANGAISGEVDADLQVELLHAFVGGLCAAEVQSPKISQPFKTNQSTDIDFFNGLIGPSHLTGVAVRTGLPARSLVRVDNLFLTAE